MTNSKVGLISALSREGTDCITVAGLANGSATGIYRRTIYAANGKSCTFTAEWTFDEKLPYDIAGKKPLRDAIGAIYHDSMREADIAYLQLDMYNDVQLDRKSVV